jgi:hypothetical protein
MLNQQIYGQDYNVKPTGNHIKYEHSELNKEYIYALDKQDKMTEAGFQISSFDGYTIKNTVKNFAEDPRFNFKSVDFLYDDLISAARSLPRSLTISQLVNNYYLSKFMINLNRIYYNSPAFFVNNLQKDPAKFEVYQKYYYLLCFIHYVSYIADIKQLEKLPEYTQIRDWILPRRDGNIPYILEGPTNNVALNINFEEHYTILLSGTSNMSEIVSYLQLSTQQNINIDTSNILQTLRTNPNVYDKNPDYARAYTLSFDSKDGLKVTIDDNNNLLFDCSYVNIGSVKDVNYARYNELPSTMESNAENSRITINKINDLFNLYSRITITKCSFAESAYISSLDMFSPLFLIFQGVLCNERNIYSVTGGVDYLKFAGQCVYENGLYNFVPRVSDITYRPNNTRVTNFIPYLTNNIHGENSLIPNEFTATVLSSSFYNWPISYEYTNTQLKLPDTSYYNTPYDDLALYRIFSYVNNEMEPSDTMFYSESKYIMQLASKDTTNTENLYKNEFKFDNEYVYAKDKEMYLYYYDTYDYIMIDHLYFTIKIVKDVGNAYQWIEFKDVIDNTIRIEPGFSLDVNGSPDGFSDLMSTQHIAQIKSDYVVIVYSMNATKNIYDITFYIGNSIGFIVQLNLFDKSISIQIMGAGIKRTVIANDLIEEVSDYPVITDYYDEYEPSLSNINKAFHIYDDFKYKFINADIFTKSLLFAIISESKPEENKVNYNYTYANLNVLKYVINNNRIEFLQDDVNITGDAILNYMTNTLIKQDLYIVQNYIVNAKVYEKAYTTATLPTAPIITEFPYMSNIQTNELICNLYMIDAGKRDNLEVTLLLDNEKEYITGYTIKTEHTSKQGTWHTNTYARLVKSNTITYIEDANNKLYYAVMINYTYESGMIIINNIVITMTTYNTTKFSPRADGVYVSDVQTVKYTNKIGVYPKINTEILYRTSLIAETLKWYRSTKFMFNAINSKLFIDSMNQYFNIIYTPKRVITDEYTITAEKKQYINNDFFLEAFNNLLLFQTNRRKETMEFVAIYNDMMYITPKTTRFQLSIMFS